MVRAILVIARQDAENATPTRTAHGHSEQIYLMARAGATAAGAAALSSRRAEWADAIPHLGTKQREFFLQQLRSAVRALHLRSAGHDQLFKVSIAYQTMIFVYWHSCFPFLPTADDPPSSPYSMTHHFTCEIR